MEDVTDEGRKKTPEEFAAELRSLGFSEAAIKIALDKNQDKLIPVTDPGEVRRQQLVAMGLDAATIEAMLRAEEDGDVPDNGREGSSDGVKEKGKGKGKGKDTSGTKRDREDADEGGSSKKSKKVNKTGGCRVRIKM